MARVTGDTSETNNNFNTANGTGSAVRGKLNEILTALRTINAGTNDPSGAANVVQFQPHINNNILKICTAVDSNGDGTFTTIGDITNDNLGLLPVDGSNPMTGNLQLPVGSETAPTLHFGQTNTGIFKGASNRVSVTSAGTQVFFADGTGININASKELRWKDTDNSNYIGFKAANNITSNLTLTLPTADGSSGQALVTNGSGVLSFATVASSGGGVVKNIVQTVYSGAAVLDCNNIESGQSFIDVTGMTLNITPQDAGNKILIEFDLNMMLQNFQIFYINLVRVVGNTATVLALPNSPPGSGHANMRATTVVSTLNAGTTIFRTPCSFRFLDTPNTTSQVTYKLTIGSNTTDTTYRKAYINRENLNNFGFSSSQIMATEYDI